MLFCGLSCFAEDVVQVRPFQTRAGVVEDDYESFNIELTNTTKDVWALELNLYLPKGMEILNIEGSYAVVTDDTRVPYNKIKKQSEYTSEATYNETGEYYKIVLYTTTTKTIAIGSGSILNVYYSTNSSMSDGVYPIAIKGAVLSDENSAAIESPSESASYVVIGTSNPMSAASKIDLSGMTGYMPSFVVDELNTAIASNTNLKTLNLSGVTGLGGDLSVPEGAFWHTANAAKLNRTFTAGAKSTICLPFEISSSVASSLGKFYQFDGISDGKVVMRQTTGALSANTPYIYEPSSAQAGIGVTDATISFSENPVTENAEAQYTFKGTYEPITWASPVGIYGFAKAGVEGFDPGQFVRGGSGVSIAPYRAYLEYTGEGKLSAARTRGIDELPVSLGIIYIDSYGNTTIIDSAVSVTKKQTGNWYGVDGTGYGDMPTRKGIYINNGKKVVIK